MDFLDLAARLASKVDWRDVYPNPRVGCVIVRDGEVVASGVHEKYGGAHAEVSAIGELSPGLYCLGSETKPGLVEKGGLEVYVTLEPCDCFEGKKTGSCTDALIRLNPGKVVIGCTDEMFGGKNVEKLRSAGIEMEVLNHAVSAGLARLRPRVILKMAQTLDGKIAPERTPSGIVEGISPPLKLRRGDKGPIYISSMASRRLVHEWRSEVDGILTTTGTVNSDDPLLDCRLVDRDPVDVFIFGNSEVADDARVWGVQGRDVVQLKGHDLRKNLREMAECGVRSVLTECGSVVGTALLREDLVDEVRLFISPVIWGEGVDVFGEELDLSGFEVCSLEEVGGDVLVIYKKVR